MRTNVARTSIDCWHGHVIPNSRDGQEQRILAYLATVADATIGEIAAALGLINGTVSARQNKLRNEDKLIEFSTSRKCRISGITCKPLRIVRGQVELF